MDGSGESRTTPLSREALRDVATGALATGWVPVAGGSMFPVLPAGSRVRARPPEGPVPVGALILFELGPLLTVHRVIGRRRGLLRTKGDASHREDPGGIPPERVLGVVVVAERRGRRLALDRPAWRLAGRVLAWASLLMDWKCRLLLPPSLRNSEGPLGRFVRGGLTLGNRVFPCLALLLLGRGRRIPDSPQATPEGP